MSKFKVGDRGSMTTDWVDELLEKSKLATPGPYKYDCGNGEVESEHNDHYRCAIAHRDDNRFYHYEQFELPLFPKDPHCDMEFIAAAYPERVAALCESVRILRSALEEMYFPKDESDGRTTCYCCEDNYDQKRTSLARVNVLLSGVK